jgi:hypothetical protein
MQHGCKSLPPANWALKSDVLLVQIHVHRGVSRQWATSSKVVWTFEENESAGLRALLSMPLTLFNAFRQKLVRLNFPGEPTAALYPPHHETSEVRGINTLPQCLFRVADGPVFGEAIKCDAVDRFKLTIQKASLIPRNAPSIGR